MELFRGPYNIKNMNVITPLQDIGRTQDMARSLGIGRTQDMARGLDIGRTQDMARGLSPCDL